MSAAQRGLSKMGFAKTFVLPCLLIFLVPILALGFFLHAQGRFDAEAREALLKQANAILHEDVPIAPMYLAVNPFGYTAKVHGFKERIDVSILFEDISVDA